MAFYIYRIPFEAGFCLFTFLGPMLAIIFAVTAGGRRSDYGSRTYSGRHTCYSIFIVATSHIFYLLVDVKELINELLACSIKKF